MSNNILENVNVIVREETARRTDLYSLVKKQLRIMLGCAERLAIAATSQQSPIDPCAGSCYIGREKRRISFIPGVGLQVQSFQRRAGAYLLL